MQLSVFYRFNIDRNFQTKLLIIRTSIGPDAFTFRYVPLKGAFLINKSDSKSSSKNSDNKLARISAINDTLKVIATNYNAKSVAITSYEQQLDIILGTIENVGRSSGCGKDLSSLKSGTHKITSAGLSREYIIDIPANYDKNKPYRLIFGMHCMGSNMQGVVGDKYYQLKRIADSTKTPCIFVAPQGYSDNSPWRTGDNKDHIFFDDMHKLFKEDLCIDTTRVFSCGFSFGSMFTYSLSTSHQNQLRAVACYSPANYNIYLPTNTHLPIAYMSTTGLDDNLCPWDGGNNQGAKYAAIGHANDNGCEVPANIPTTTKGSRNHLCYDVPGCDDKYPVKICTFDGGHQAGHMDGVSGDNSSRSWIPIETWNFFMQF